MSACGRDCEFEAAPGSRLSATGLGPKAAIGPRSHSPRCLPSAQWRANGTREPVTPGCIGFTATSLNLSQEVTMRTRTTLVTAAVLAISSLLGWLAASTGLLATASAQGQATEKSVTGGSPILPVPDAPFGGVIGRKASESKPDFPRGVAAPEGAPNILLIMTDDTGFGAAGTFGGPIPTPNFDRVAKSGLRYNQFHTTALCSPTRAALLTGRNHHTAGMANITEFATGYPGYTSLIPKSVGTVGNILVNNGYNTAWFGKHHLVPEWMQGPGGPYDQWAAGLGFDYFYGFLGGDSDQWHPALFENNTPVLPPFGDPNYILIRDLADRSINWIRTQHAAAPDKPFLLYFAPGNSHAP